MKKNECPLKFFTSSLSTYYFRGQLMLKVIYKETRASKTFLKVRVWGGERDNENEENK